MHALNLRCRAPTEVPGHTLGILKTYALSMQSLMEPLDAPVSQFLRNMERVNAIREEQVEPNLLARVQAVKRFQSARFSRTYTDLLNSHRYGQATAFFMTDLYGPTEFRARDAQLARVAPKLMRMFPDKLQGLMCDLSALHALSEEFDNGMAKQVRTPNISAAQYQTAWRACGNPTRRVQQLELTLKLGRALDRLTRNRLLRTTLHLMRAPAKAADLADLQRVLEAGFDAFAQMHGAAEFLSTIEVRETNEMTILFGFDPTQSIG